MIESLGRDVRYQILDCKMPRPRARSSRTTALVVAPWRTAKRRGRSGQKYIDATLEGRFDETVKQSDNEEEAQDKRKARKMREGLELLIREYPFSYDLSKEVYNSTKKESLVEDVCVLAFEESGGHFVGIALKQGSRSPRFHLNGRKCNMAFPDCKFNDAQELYQLEVLDDNGDVLNLSVCNSGGDHARIDTGEAIDAEFYFRCVELHALTSTDSFIAPYFSDLEGCEEIVVNIGVMQISKRKQEDDSV